MEGKDRFTKNKKKERRIRKTQITKGRRIEKESY